MTTQCTIINPIKYPLWNELILSHDEYTFFHSSHWAKVISETYGYVPLYFTVLTDNKIDTLIPVMEVCSALTGKRGVSLPFSDYCVPIISSDIKARYVLDCIFEHGASAGWKYVEIRGGTGFLQAKPSSSFNGHVLELSGNELLLQSQLKKSTLRSINKAVTAGVTINIGHELQSVKEFYRLHCMTRKRHGLPPQPFCFFKNIHEQIISKDCGLVILASLNNRTIAGAVYFHFGNKALYKFGASDDRYQQVRPNNLVMWEAIQCYCRHGYHYFDFGRTDCENTGLLQFKRGWGGQEYPINYYRYDFRQKAFIADLPKVKGMRRQIFKMMPIPLLKIAGSVLYQHAG